VKAGTAVLAAITMVLSMASVFVASTDGGFVASAQAAPGNPAADIMSNYSPVTVATQGTLSATDSTLVVTPSPPAVGQPATAKVTVKDTIGVFRSGVRVNLGVNGSATFGALADPQQGTTYCDTNAQGYCEVSLSDGKGETVEVTATIDIDGTTTGISGSPADVTFTQAEGVPLPNPALNGGCGQNVALVVDLSGSMDPGNATSPSETSLYQLKKATSQYVDVLKGSNSQVALFTFGTYSPNIDPANPTGVTRYNGNHPLTSVQTDAGAQQVKDWINAWRGWGWTRWDLGLQAAADSGEHYDYVLFITDGYPTDDRGNTVSDTSFPNKKAVVNAANAVKAEGTRIIVIYAATGSGSVLNDEQRANVEAISGPTHDENVMVNDYYEMDWSAVAGQFQTLANMCTRPVDIDATRTIHYVDAKGTTVFPDEVQTVSYTKTADLRSGEVTYEPALENLSFAAVTSPVKAGYTADQPVVGSAAVPVTTDPPNLEVTVKYTVNVFDFDNSSWNVTPMSSAPSGFPYANGNSQTDYWTATLTAKDQYNAAMTDLTADAISFGVDPMDGVVISPVTNNGDGTYSVRITSTVASSLVASVTYNNQPVGRGKTISFQAGGFSYTKSTFDVTPQANVADQSTWVTVSTGANYYTGTLTAKDDYGNVKKNLDVSEIIFSKPDTVTKTDVVNNANGTYTVRFSSTVANTVANAAVATAAVTYQGTPVGVAKPIPFKAGEESINPQCSDGQEGTNLSVDRTSLPVGELSQATAYITDEFCNAKEGVDVTFALNPGTAGIVRTVTGTTGADGKAFATVTDTAAETVTLSATISKGEVPSAKDIAFTEGDLDPNTSTFDIYRTDPSASAVVADGTQSWTGKLIASDRQGNLLADLDLADLAFAAAPAGVTVSGVRNEGDGVYTVTYTSKKAGTYTASLSYKGQRVGDGKTMSFVAGPVDDKYSTVTVSPERQAAGSPVTITVTAKDVNDNPVMGLTTAGVVVTGRSAGLPDLAISGFQEIADGVYAYQATSRLVGEFEVRATVTGTLLSEAPHVTFYAGGVCVNGADPVNPDNVTQFKMGDNDALANGVARDSARAYAYDCYGNPVEGATVRVEDKSTGDVAGFLRPVNQEVTTGSDGTVMVYWTSTRAGVFTAEGTIDGLRPESGVMNRIRFTNGAGDPAKSDLVVTPSSPIQVESSYTAMVTVRDATGNLVEDAAVSFRLDPVSPAWLSDDSCVTGLDGTCHVSVTSDLVTTVAVHATLPVNGQRVDLGGNGVAAKASPQMVAFIAGPVCVVNCDPVDKANVTRVEVVIDGSEANGQATDVAKAYAYDRKGNPKAGVAVASSTSDAALGIRPPVAMGADGTVLIEYTSTVAGPHMAFVTIDSKVPLRAVSSDGTRTDGRVTLNFGSGTASAADSYLTIDPTTPQAVRSVFTVTAHVKDVNKNSVNGVRVDFPAVENLALSDTSCVSGGDGTCQVTVTSRIMGIYTVSARLGLQDLSNTVNAQFSAGEVWVGDCAAEAGNNCTRVEVTLDGQVADGVDRDIATAYAYDFDGNPVKDAVVQSAPKLGETSLTVQPNVAATGADGTTTIWYTSTVKGPHQADATIAGKTPQTSPITVHFGSGDGDRGHSSWVVAPAGPLTVGEGAESTYTATATVRDAQNNPVEDAVVVFRIDPAYPMFTPANSCSTNGQGVCSVNVYSTKSGTYSMTASIAAGPIDNATTHDSSASIAWRADAVCSQAEGCEPVDPNLPGELRTRVEITVDNQVADGTARDVVTTWAFDKWGNAVEGALVQSTTTASAMTVQTGIDPIGKDGSSTIWYSSMIADSYPASVLVDGRRPVGSPVELTFVAGSVCVVEAGCEPVGPGTDPSRQTRVQVILNDQPVRGLDSVAVYAFDKTGNAVEGTEFDIRTNDATLSFGGGGRTAAVTSGVHNTVAATSAVGGSHAASAFVNGVELIRHGSPMDLRFLGAPAITSPKDGDLSNDNPLVVTGTGQNVNDVIVVTDGEDEACVAVVRLDLTWFCEAFLEDGDHTLVAVETNEDGTDSPPSDPVTVEIDTVAPSAPEVDPSNGSQIIGTTDPGTTVTVTDEDGKPVEGCVDVVPDASGSFSCMPAVPLPPKSEVSVTSKDSAGNISEPTHIVIVALRVEIAYDSRLPGQDQVVSGYSFNPGEEVCVFLGETKIGCEKANEEGTVTFSFTVLNGTPAGTHSVTLKGAMSGNISGSFEVKAIQVKTGGRDPGQHLRGMTVGLILATVGVGGGIRARKAINKH